MKILSSILIGSFLAMSVLALMPTEQAYAGHITTANTLGNAVTGVDITAAGVNFRQKSPRKIATTRGGVSVE